MDPSLFTQFHQAAVHSLRSEAEAATAVLSRRLAELEAELEAQRGAAAAGAAQTVRLGTGRR